MPRTVRLALVAGLLALTGCAAHFRDLAPVRDALVAGDVPGAMTRFEAMKGRKSDLLYLLEKGYMLHLAGRWQESNEAFEAAEIRSDELQTRSISNEAAALLTNDRVRPYRALPYEMQLVQYYRALNYLALGQSDEALVEARKANQKLADYTGAPIDEVLPRQDAFLQYFTGLLYEGARDADNAAVSFRDASRLYSRDGEGLGSLAPRWLDEGYYAAARHLGLDGEADSLAAADPDLQGRARDHNADNLVVFFETGFVPYRESVSITLPVFEERGKDGDSWHAASRYVDRYGSDIYAWRADRVKLDHVLSFAFPELTPVPDVVASCEVVLPDGETVDADPALDLAAVARAEFQERLPGALLRTVARAIAKELMRKQAGKKGEGLGILVNVLNVATETADTRGWIFLPARIQMAKLRVPPGKRQLTVRLRDGGGAVVEEHQIEVDPQPGVTSFAAVRCFH